MAAADRTKGKRVCIIGAGSSGMVALKVLRGAGLDAVCLEKGSGIGGNWRYGNDNGMSAAYESLTINTSKGRMAYADYPMPADYPEYPDHRQILAYFENYVDHFGVRPHIRFGTTVLSVVRDGEGWRVTSSDQDGERTEAYDAVVVANGHHWKQRWPTYPGEFSGTVIHAHDYRTPELLAGKRVLVVGIGNSGVDIACEASAVAAWTGLSTRRGAHVFPKFAFGKPIDSYTSPLVSRLPLKAQETVMRALLFLVRGSQASSGVPEPDHPLTAAHPTVSENLLRIVKAGGVRMMREVAALEGEQVRFVDGRQEAVDVLVYATGYDIAFPFFAPGVVFTDGNDMRLYQRVVPMDQPGLYFVGLVQPLGAIMPLAEAQSHWVAGLLAGTHRLPDAAAMAREIDDYRAAQARRYIPSKRHTIQVDFYPYLHALQTEMRRAVVRR